MRLTKFYAIAALISVGLLSGCSEETEVSTDLSSPEAAAMRALENDDTALYVILGRQTNIPGASAVDHSAKELEAHCGFKPIAHADVFEGKEEFASLKAKTTYAVSYNKAVLPSCIERIKSFKGS